MIDLKELYQEKANELVEEIYNVEFDELNNDEKYIIYIEVEILVHENLQIAADNLREELESSW